jgi:ADP-heptose:LPS heptosyltransferase
VPAACRNPLPALPRADRILVIRLGALGDVVRTLPAFAALRARYPGAHIAWLVETQSESALRAQPGIDDVIVFPREVLESLWRGRRFAAFVREALAFVGRLRRERFELVLDFHGILKTGLLSRASGARVRVGYARPFGRELSQCFASHRARVEPARLSRFARNAALVDFLGAQDRHAPADSLAAGARGVAAGGFHVDAEQHAKMRKRLAAVLERNEEWGSDRPLAVIHPGSSARASYKRYPAAAWGAVARALRADGIGCIVSSGGEAEREIARAVVEASNGAALLAPETADVGELAALFAACRVFLGSDSGPLHVASLVGTPVVQLLGPTDAVENHPFAGTPSRSVRVPVACSPCRRGCRAASCMQLIPPAAVHAAARELLAGQGASGGHSELARRAAAGVSR